MWISRKRVWKKQASGVASQLTALGTMARTLGETRPTPALASGVSGTAAARDFASGSRSPQTPSKRVGAVREWRLDAFHGWKALHVNDPSAGSPTDTLLRLLRPLPQIICPTSQPNDHGKPITGLIHIAH